MDKRTKKLFLTYLLVFIYIILINISLTVLAVSLHELGHFFVGIFYGCKNIKMVLFDTSNLSTYTEMNCEEINFTKGIAFGPIILVIPFGSLFFILKEKPEKYYGLMIIGLNIVILVTDIQTIIKSIILYNVQFIFGFLLIVLSEILMIDSVLGGKKLI